MAGKIGSFFGASGAGETPSGEATPAPETAAAATTPAPEPQTLIGAGSQLEGRLVCKGPARLGGVITGEIRSDGLVTIEADAKVVGDLDVEELVVHGHVKGNIVAAKRVSLAPTAEIDGDIHTPSLTIKEGALVKGRVDVAPQPRRSETTTRSLDPATAT